MKIRVAIPRLSTAAIARFQAKVQYGTAYSCWEWIGARTPRGYGRFAFAGHTFYAHRIAFYINTGQPLYEVCHSCDNPACCNPMHLFDGTHADNMHDMQAKGRDNSTAKALPGARNGRAVLTESMVWRLRRAKRAGKNISAMARNMGISVSAAHKAANNRSWKHLKNAIS